MSTAFENRAYWRWFNRLSAIPRASGNEKAVSDMLMEFAEEHGLEAVRDDSWNVLIRKPGSRCLENALPIVLQAHTDMVCTAAEGRKVDFLNDPIQIMLEGNAVHADGTTLGADNGLGAAYILSVLESGDIPHPPIEAVFTVQEEVGMKGAKALDVSLLSSSLFINLDSEEEGVFCVSCAGGRRSRITFRNDRVISPKGLFPRRLLIKGLPGGHSGLDIIRRRPNANKLLFRTLDVLQRTYGIHLHSVNGGTADNSIPAESSATFLSPAEDLTACLESLQKDFQVEFAEFEGHNIRVYAESTAYPDTVLSMDAAKRVVAAGLAMPDGVISMDPNIKDLVESSTNLGLVFEKDGSVCFQSQSRSSSSAKKEEICQKIASVATQADAEIEFFGDYPAWEFNPDSRLQKVFKSSFLSLFGKAPVLQGIHAGLECGILSEKFNSLGRKVDFISLGPTITGAHSPKETAYLDSAERTWALLCDVLSLLS